MMTETEPDPTMRADATPAPLSTTSSITTFGTLAWIGWVWAIAAVVFTIVMSVVSFHGDPDTSMWEGLGAGWQRWILLAAGITMCHNFGPMLVSNGVTRARLAESTLVSMVTLALLGATFIGLGFLLEGIFFDVNGWSRELQSGPRVEGAGFFFELMFEYFLLLMAYFLAGWLIGLAFHARQALFLPSILIALVPVASGETLLHTAVPGLPFGLLDDIDRPSYLVGVVLTAGAIAGVSLIARRLTRELVLT